jgi:hypothetical protein
MSTDCIINQNEKKAGESGTVKNKTRNAPKAANLRGCWAMLLTMAGTLKGLT